MTDVRRDTDDAMTTSSVGGSTAFEVVMRK